MMLVVVIMLRQSGNERLHSSELLVVYPGPCAMGYEAQSAGAPAEGGGTVATGVDCDIAVLCSNGISISADGCPKRLANCLNSCRNLDE